MEDPEIWETKLTEDGPWNAPSSDGSRAQPSAVTLADEERSFLTFMAEFQADPTGR